jgi:hypothetical protein
MQPTLKNPPYLFAIRLIDWHGRKLARLVQVSGRAGDIGRVAPKLTNEAIRTNTPLAKHHFSTPLIKA